MTSLAISLASTDVPATEADRHLWFRWLVRPRRVLMLLAAVWVLNLFDLGFTIVEAERESFVELNPVAARLLESPPSHLIAYKAFFVVGGSLILLRNCRHSITELGCWFLLAAYSAVGVAWQHYYADLLQALEDPAVNVCVLSGRMILTH